jgi:hypothetical protein
MAASRWLTLRASMSIAGLGMLLLWAHSTAAVPSEHEYITSSEQGVGTISGRTFTKKEVRFANVDGLAIFEGDIVLGTVEEVTRVACARPPACCT